MNPFDIFLPVLVYPIQNILVMIYQLLISVHIPYALGFSIIALTVLIRIVLYPFVNAQLKTAKKMQAISGHISSLKEKHKGDAKKLQAETMKLYKEHGVNPAAGCLPLLIQMPLIYALYTVLQELAHKSPVESMAQINKIAYFPFEHLAKPWDPSFFGMSLAANPSALFSTMPALVLIPIVTALLQFVQSKMMLPATPPVKNGKKKNDDFAQAFQSQSAYIFPAMIGYFSFISPIGLSLYWNTFTIFGIIQQYKISGWGGLKKKK